MGRDDSGAAVACPRNDEATTDMANIQQKSKDPTEAALSAIQEALNINLEQSSSSTSSSTSSSSTDTAAVPGPADDLFRPAERELPARPANDDREQVGQILQALQRHPSGTPYLFASMAAAIWVAIGLLADRKSVV